MMYASLVDQRLQPATRQVGYQDGEHAIQTLACMAFVGSDSMRGR
jgi:hypothetical protein